MADKRDVELAIAVTTDMQKAHADLRTLNGELTDVAGTATDLGRSVDTSNKSLAQTAALVAKQEAEFRALISVVDPLSVKLSQLTATEQRLREAFNAGQINAQAFDKYSATLAKARAEMDGTAAAAQAAARAADQEEAEFRQLMAAVDPLAGQLDRLADTQRQLQAAFDSGRINSEQLTRYTSALDANRASLLAANANTKKLSISSGQYGAAIRMLPAQITDVATSLASGAPVWLVAIQQGGQIKDSFGGIGNTFKALRSLISPVVVGIAAATAAVAALVLAYKQGSDEADGFNRALILTGNYAGTNADALASMAARIDDVAGTHHAAAEALTEVASRGKFTAEQIEQIGRAAELMRVATGKAVKETVDEFEQLARDPVAGIEKLNDKYHFLTAAVYSQIAALQRQGKEQEAAKLAVDTYSAVVDERSQAVVENLGDIEKAWKAIKKGTSEAWDEVIGNTRNKTLDDLKSELANLNKLKPASALNQARLGTFATEDINGQKRKQLQDEIARREAAAAAAQQQAKQQALNEARIKAEKEVQALRDQTMTNAEKREKEIAAYRRNAETLNISAEQQAKDIANIEAKYKDPAQKKDPRESTFATLNKQITERIALLQAATDSETKLTDAQKFAEQVQATLADGTTKLTTAQRAQIDVRLQDLATIDLRLQKARSEKEEYEKTERAYKNLSDALRTPIEASLDTAIDRVKVLNEALEKGIITSDQYQQKLSGIVAADFQKAPDFAGLSPEFGGVDSEQARLDKSREQLNSWYSEQQALLEQFRANKIGSEESWNAQEFMLEQQHQAQLGALQQAQNQLMLVNGQNAFDSLTAIAGDAAGKQSGAYKALFAVSKGFATAQAAVSLAINVAKAAELGWPANLPAIASALAQGAQITALLSSAQFADGGHVTGAGTGTSDSIPAWLSNGEFVTRAAVMSQPGAKKFMESFNLHGMAALSDWSLAVRHATGGLAGIPAPVMAAPARPVIELADGGTRSTTLKNDIALHVYDDPQRIADAAFNSRHGQKSFLVMLARDPARVRSVLNING